MLLSLGLLVIWYNAIKRYWLILKSESSLLDFDGYNLSFASCEFSVDKVSYIGHDDIFKAIVFFLHARKWGLTMRIVILQC